VEGKVITFAVTAFDESGEIGRGTHKRVIVNSQKFLEKTYMKL
jgi:predicted thioesterase